MFKPHDSQKTLISFSLYSLSNSHSQSPIARFARLLLCGCVPRPKSAPRPPPSPLPSHFRSVSHSRQPRHDATSGPQPAEVSLLPRRLAGRRFPCPPLLYSLTPDAAEMTSEGNATPKSSKSKGKQVKQHDLRTYMFKK